MGAKLGKRPSYKVIVPPERYECAAVNRMIYSYSLRGLDWVLDNISIKDLQDMIRGTTDPGHQVLLRDLKEYLAEAVKFRNKLHIISQRFNYDAYARTKEETAPPQVSEETKPGGHPREWD